VDRSQGRIEDGIQVCAQGSRIKRRQTAPARQEFMCARCRRAQRPELGYRSSVARDYQPFAGRDPLENVPAPVTQLTNCYL
jgi:hypothetical protein